MKKLNVRLVRLLKESRGQFIAVAMVIILGLGIFVAMSTAALNLRSSLNLYYDDYHVADIFSQVTELPENKLNDLRDIPGITSVQGRVVNDAPLRVSDPAEKVRVRIIGATPSDPEINQLFARDGVATVYKQTDVLVIDTFARERGIEIGDIITPHIMGRDYQLTVRGIVSSPEYIYLMENEQTMLPDYKKFGILFTTEAFAQEAFAMGQTYNEAVFKVSAGVDLDEVKDEVEDVLEPYGVQSLYLLEDQISNRMVQEEIKGVEQSSTVIPMVFLGVAAAIMGVMINRLVKGDRITIGILKSMGYRNIDMVKHYTALAVFVGLIGGVAGVLMGSVMSSYFTEMYNTFFSIPVMKVTFYWRYLFLSAIMVSAFSVAAGLLGARGVLNISPAESMRPSAPKQGKRTILEKTVFWKHISFTNKNVLRSLLRNKKRVIFISAGISLTFCIIIIPLISLNSFDSLFGKMYGEFQTMDYNVNFSRAISEDGIQAIDDELPIDYMEAKIEFPFTVHYRWKEKDVNFVGIQANSRFFNFEDLNGNPIEIKEGDVFVSEGLANVLAIERGDPLWIETFIPDREDQQIKVTQVIQQNLGANIYMDINTMREFFLDAGYTNGVYIDSKADVKAGLEDFRFVGSVQSLKDMQDVFLEFMDLMIYSLGVMLVFGGVLGFAIVYNATILSINERRLEFSALQIMGFSKQEIFRMLLRENLVLSTIGILAGIPLSIVMMDSVMKQFSTDLYSLRIEWEPIMFVQAAFFTIVFVWIAEAATYQKIKRLDFIEALKNRIT
jgi:putative ABC transport system permease protein